MNPRRPALSQGACVRAKGFSKALAFSFRGTSDRAEEVRAPKVNPIRENEKNTTLLIVGISLPDAPSTSHTAFDADANVHPTVSPLDKRREAKSVAAIRLAIAFRGTLHRRGVSLPTLKIHRSGLGQSRSTFTLKTP